MNKFRLLIIFIFIILSFSCENDLPQPIAIADFENIDVQLAKDWIKQNYEITAKGNLTTRWDKALNFGNSIEIPYAFNGKVGLPNATPGFERLGRQRLVITPNGTSFLLTQIQFIPSDEFVGDMKRVNSRNFKAEKFDGIITIQKFGADEIKILQLEQGIIKSISKAEKKTESNQKVNCTIYEECTLWFIFINGEYAYSDETCDDYCSYEETTYPDGSYDGLQDGENPFPWPYEGDIGYAYSGVPGDTPQLQAFEQDYKGQMTSSELEIYDNMNRFQQVKYLLNAQNALTTAQNLFPNSSQHNDKADAFRHAYFSLLNVIDLGIVLAENLGTAHENWPENPIEEKFMDLYNNEQGREAYQDWYNAGGNVSTTDIIQGLVDSGELVIIKNGSIVPSNE